MIAWLTTHQTETLLHIIFRLCVGGCVTPFRIDSSLGTLLWFSSTKTILTVEATKTFETLDDRRLLQTLSSECDNRILMVLRRCEIHSVHSDDQRRFMIDTQIDCICRRKYFVFRYQSPVEHRTPFICWLQRIDAHKIDSDIDVNCSQHKERTDCAKRWHIHVCYVIWKYALYACA